MSNLADCYRILKQYDKAILMFEQSLEKMGFSTTAPITRSKLAKCYSDMGQYDKALPHYEACLERRKEVLGDDHPDTLGLMLQLAFCYIKMEQPDKAEPLLHISLPYFKK